MPLKKSKCCLASGVSLHIQREKIYKRGERKTERERGENLNDDTRLRGALSFERIQPLCGSVPSVLKMKLSDVRDLPLPLPRPPARGGQRGSRAPCVIRRLRCDGASNLHTAPLCISKESQRRPPVRDRYR